MDAVEYVKAMHRLCKSQDCYFGRTPGCPLLNKEGKKYGYCIANIGGCAEKAVQIVEQWAKDNPVKTRQSEFLKMFPNAQIHDDVIWLCPKYIGCDYRPERNCDEISCLDCKRKFWLTEVTDNGNG